MTIRTTTAPARYVQAKGAMSELGQHVARIEPLLVSEDFVN